MDSDSCKGLDKRINRILLKIDTVHTKYTTATRNILRIFVYKFTSVLTPNGGLEFPQENWCASHKNNNLLLFFSALAKTKFRIC
jgi:hypothetical protein